MLETNPYEFADRLKETANDLVSDMTSYTVQDIADILRATSDFIIAYADDYNSHLARTRVTFTIGHDVIDLTNEILPMITGSLLEDWIRNAIRGSMASGHDHHGHSH